MFPRNIGTPVVTCVSNLSKSDGELSSKLQGAKWSDNEITLLCLGYDFTRRPWSPTFFDGSAHRENTLAILV